MPFSSPLDIFWNRHVHIKRVDVQAGNARRATGEGKGNHRLFLVLRNYCGPYLPYYHIICRWDFRRGGGGGGRRGVGTSPPSLRPAGP